MQGHAQTDPLEVTGEVRLLWSLVIEDIPPPDGPAGPADDELEVFKPAQSGGEHVHLGPVLSPPSHPLGLHADTDVEVFAPEGPVAVVLLVDGILGDLVRSAGSDVVVVQRVGQTGPLQLDGKTHPGDVEQGEAGIVETKTGQETEQDLLQLQPACQVGSRPGIINQRKIK